MVYERISTMPMKQLSPRFSSVLLSCCALLLVSMVGLLFPWGARAVNTNKTQPLAPAIQGDLAAHDPSLIKEGNTYYVFSTGGGINIRTSTDLVTWKYAGTVFSSIPSWVASAVGSITDLWAPD